MKIQLRLIIGLLYLVIVKIENTFVRGASCTVDKMAANCVRKGLKEIPQDLDMTLEILDASYNPIEKIGEDDFKRYSSLIQLRLIGLTVSSGGPIYFESNSFAPLKNLDNLDISESALDAKSKEVVWPEKLKRLWIGAMKATKFNSLNLTKLHHLEDLNASLNTIEDFPGLYEDAPLSWIDLYDNPLKNVRAEHLAPFCLLKYLRVRISKGGLLNTPPYSCQCRRLEQWMIMYGISGFDFTCHKFLSDHKDDCEVKKFDDETNKKRKICLDRIPTSRFWKFMIIITLISLIFPSIYLGYEFYKRYKRRKSGEDDSGGDDGSEPDASAPSGNDDAPEPSSEE